MSFRLLGIAAAAAVTTLATVAPASAGCWSCGCAPSYSYVQPRVVYVQPRCGGYYGAYYQQRPVFVVNQGPTFTEAVPPEAMPNPYIRHRARPYPYGASSPYWRHHVRHHRGHFYRAHRAHRVHAPMFRPYRAHGPRVVYGPKRIVVPHRAHPVHAPMHRHMRHHGHGPQHHGQTPRRRHHQP